MLNFTKSIITLSLTTYLTSCAVSATSVWAEQSQFLKSLVNSTEASVHHIATSETLGVSLLSDTFQTVNTLKVNAEHLDYRPLPNKEHTGILTTLDVNTGEIVLAQVNLKTPAITIKQRFKQDQIAYDAICLNRSGDNLSLFTVDVLGIATQYSIADLESNKWQLREVNRFAVGTNIKSCAVDETTESLYLTEENIGVWRYSTNPEHEVMRELIQLPPELEVEYVDTSSTGDVVVVSPDINKLWLLNQQSNQFEAIELPVGVVPKAVQVTRNNDTLLFNVFDDENEVLIKKSVSKQLIKSKTTEKEVMSLIPYGETDHVIAYGDAADDPAIWVNQKRPEQSLVYATDKKYGLNVYSLNGKLVYESDIGRINNIDIRYNVKIGSNTVDLAAASNRTTNSISLFAIDKLTGMPTYLNDIATDLADPYGLCMSSHNGQVSVWINDTDGRFQGYQLNLANTSTGKNISAKKVMEWQVPSQPEGCVVDDASQRLFYGEESTGVWLKELNTNKKDTFIAGIVPTIEADIEGMELYSLNGQNYLIVSSQGNNRYAVYAIDDNNRFLGAFDITANWQEMIDGVSETDGLAVTSIALGKHLPYGLLVVQDGRNVMPKAPQNFKLIDGSLLKDWIEQRVN